MFPSYNYLTRSTALVALFIYFARVIMLCYLIYFSGFLDSLCINYVIDFIPASFGAGGLNSMDLFRIACRYIGFIQNLHYQAILGKQELKKSWKYIF